MSGTTILVIADPAAPYLKALERVPKDVRLIVSHEMERVKDAAPEADALFYAETNAALLDAALPLAKKLRWVHVMWTGVEGVLQGELLKHPVPLTNGRGVFGGPLGDWVAAVMLHFAFDLGRVIRQQRAGVWQPFLAGVLPGKTLGIVGYGSLGRAAATRARAFGMKVAALRRRPELSADDARVDASYAPAQLNELIAASDYLLLSTPLTAETRGMIGAEQMAAMKPSAVLINIGRGPVIDEAALIAALQAGKIRGAALDVFTVEPLPAGHPFYSMENVLMSPHTADRVEGFLEPAIECFLDNLKLFCAGEPLLNVVDKNAGY
ncbi:MAG TPA: D-2-hydroxyacid dehydrogenase [Bryobacteraceae bacterium]|jgi:phosphoglycerate dehydrogenase-like enzyme